MEGGVEGSRGVPCRSRGGLTITASSPGRVFAALSDPTRRLLLEWLEEEPVGTATMFAARLPITRQAVAKHLAELVEAGVVEGTRRGREMQYSLRPEGLESAAQWLEQRAVRWDRRLQALARHVESGDAEPAS